MGREVREVRAYGTFHDGTAPQGRNSAGLRIAGTLFTLCIATTGLAAHRMLTSANEQSLEEVVPDTATVGLLAKFFPDYSKLQSLAKDLPDGNAKTHAVSLLSQVESQVDAYSRFKAEAKGAVAHHLHYELDLAKNMQLEKTSHDALPALKQALKKSTFELTAAQTKLRHEQMAVGDLLAPNSAEKLHAPVHNSKGVVRMSLSQAHSSQANLPPAIRKAVAFARKAEAERYKPELEAEKKRRRTYDELHSELLHEKHILSHATQRKDSDGQRLASVTKRISHLKDAAANSLKTAKLAFEDADRVVRRGQNQQAFEQGAKLLKSSDKVPTAKDVMNDLLSK